VLAKITSLGSERDTLATQIKNELYDAEFNDTTMKAGGDLRNQCQSLLQQADALAQSASTGG
jgi:hypothetical protein